MIKEILISITLGLPTGIAAINYLDKNKTLQRNIKRKLNYVFKERGIKNSMDHLPSIKEIRLLEYGFKTSIDIKGIISYTDFEKLNDYINTLFSSTETIITNKKEYVEIEVINNPITDLNYKKINLESTKLLIGFDTKGNPIKVDMKITPYLLISGLGGQGKSYMVKAIITNLTGVNIVIINGFREDYKSNENIRHILGEEEIIKYLSNLLENIYTRTKPLYIILEEMQSFNSNKKITELIKELLSFGRHFNIYIIGIIQIATKENCKFKDLFNARCSFKQIDNSSYSVCLGCSIQEQLQQREFYLYSTSLVKGRTYNI